MSSPLPHAEPTPAVTLRGPRRGGVWVLGIFGLGWTVAGASALAALAVPQPVPALVGMAAVLLLAGVLVRARPLPDAPRPAGTRLRLRLVVVAEAVAIAAVVVLLGPREPALIAPVTAAVVGLHLLPLGTWFAIRGYVVGGLAVVGVGLAGGVLALAGPAGDEVLVRAVTGLGAGAALLLTCAALTAARR